MKKNTRHFIVGMSTTALLTAMLSTSVFAAGPASFVDIEKSFAKDAIIELNAMGIINGMDATHFAPKGTLTRAQFTAIVVRALGLDMSDLESRFPDVKGWAVGAIEAAADAGIIDGVGGGLFAPNAPLTREQAATILVRGLELKGALGDAGKTNFSDSNKISEWAKDFIALAQQYKLVQGNPDGTFSPQSTTTREQAATMAQNFLAAIDGLTPPVVTDPGTPPVQPPVQPPVEPPVIVPPSNGGGGWYPPVTEEPPVVEPPVIEPPVVDPPVTEEPPVTEPPVTEPPVTEPPVTEPPVIEPPVVEPVATVVSDVYTTWDGDSRTMLSFTLDKDLDLTTGNLEIKFLDINGQEAKTAAGNTIVKDKTWSGYLTNADGSVKYSAGTEGAEYSNVLPGGSVIATLINGTASYADLAWFDSIVTIEITATNEAGKVDTESINADNVDASVYVTAQDFSQTVTDDVYSYDMGFKVNTDKLGWRSIATVTGTVYNGEEAVASVQITTQDQLAKFVASDIEYGGPDGQLSFNFANELDLLGVPQNEAGIHYSSYLTYLVPATGPAYTHAELTIVTKNGIELTVRYGV